MCYFELAVLCFELSELWHFLPKAIMFITKGEKIERQKFQMEGDRSCTNREKRFRIAVLLTFVSQKKHLFLTFHPSGIELLTPSCVHRANAVTKNIARHYGGHSAWIHCVKEIKEAHRQNQWCESILSLCKWRHSKVKCLTHANIYFFIHFYFFFSFAFLLILLSFSFFLFGFLLLVFRSSFITFLFYSFCFLFNLSLCYSSFFAFYFSLSFLSLLFLNSFLPCLTYARLNYISINISHDHQFSNNTTFREHLSYKSPPKPRASHKAEG